MSILLPCCYSAGKISNSASFTHATPTSGDANTASPTTGLTLQPAADSGKCVGIVPATATTPAQVNVSSCDGSDAQRWEYVGGRLESLQAQQCLDISPTAQADVGTPLALQPCTSTRATQAWIIDRSVLYIQNGTSPRSLKIAQSPATEGTAVVLADVDFNDAAQKWLVNLTDPSQTGQASQGFTISPSDAPSRCLDVQGDSIVTNVCSDAVTQRWSWLISGQLQSGDKCIGLPAGTTADGTQPTLVACDPNVSTQWWISTGGEFVNNGLTKCVDASGGSAPAAAVSIVTCNGASTQQWQMGAASY